CAPGWGWANRPARRPQRARSGPWAMPCGGQDRGRTGLRPGSIRAIACYRTASQHQAASNPKQLSSREAKTTSHETSFTTRLDPEPRAARPVALRWRADRHRSPTAIAKSTLPQVSGTSHEGDQTMNETQLTIAGNLVDDPELRFTPSGQ